jgi:uncharacterized protein (DUF2147 family)
MEMTMKVTRLLVLSLATLVFSVPVFANDNSPVGLWKSYDDGGTKAKALIRITEKNGVLQGQIEKLIRPPSEEQNPGCAKCKGARKDQPLVGMVILSNLKKEADEYSGGEILDPEVGETYKCKIQLKEGGKQLSVRGYVGVPLLGRSQIWQRQE